MDIKTKGFTMPNGDTHIFIPPSPTESERGGIKAKKKTTENVEVVVGDDDKLYVPEYPTLKSELDSTLTDETKAANAKVTGEKIFALNDDLDNHKLVLDDAVCPQMFGAVGDGVADDTQAIIQAVEATSENEILYFPNGTYRIISEIVIESR